MHPYINIAIKAARRAGTIIIRYANQMSKVTVATKSTRNDFVTNVDKLVQADIITTIKRNYPQHIVIGEEEVEFSEEIATSPSDDSVRWIIDPLDGTLNFVHTYPNFAVSIAIEVNGIVKYGVIYDPLRDELFVASKGEGAQLNERRIRVSNCSALEFAMLGTGFGGKRKPDLLPIELTKFAKLLNNCADIRRSGSAALDLAYVACGRLDGFWEYGLQIWDVAAGALLIKEAGGYVSDMQGGSNFLVGQEIVAGNRKVYSSLLNNLANT